MLYLPSFLSKLNGSVELLLSCSTSILVLSIASFVIVAKSTTVELLLL
ncbi:MAG: hypothetical protein RSC92_05785 [Clostridia bacterium]